jgi:4-alpha-glucanotransferase
MRPVSAALRALSERAGILPRYVDNDQNVRETSDETRVRLLECLGFAAGDEATARRTLAGLDAEAAARAIDPVHVCQEADARRIDVRGATFGAGNVRYEVVATDESTGEEHVARGNARVRPDGTLVGVRGPKLAPGTYRVAIHLDAGRVRTTAEQWRAVAPPACSPLSAKIGRRRAFGVWANLYSVRGRDGVGVGNLADLSVLAAMAGNAGAEFLGINPLHALRNRGLEISPYGPLSRLFRNPIYIAAERVPELSGSEHAKTLLSTSAFARELESARGSERVDYELVASVQVRLLEALWRTFRASAGKQRVRAYERYRAAEGPTLRDYATFVAIEEAMAAAGRDRDWRRWPAELRDPRSPAVAAFRERHAERVGFHCFVQFECDRQLASAAATAERAGMAIGLYTDLAVGSLASSFDAWAFPGLFVDAARLGAPPDAYSATGQDWGLPPVNPHRLRADEYRYWRQMLRAAFRHCGMLRLDHAMGVLRQFWIPHDGDAVGGAYVAFPAEELLALLALESRAAGAVVVAEDLGTVPAGFSTLLAGFGLLSSNVMFFERTAGGGFVGAASYSRRALLTANTHDQPTLAGWWRGRDVEIRRAIGMIATDTELAAARVREKALLVRRLRAERALREPQAADDPAELCAAVNRYLAAAPSPLLGVSLDDLAGETEPVNVPGIPVDRYPSWSRRMHSDVADLARDAGFARALDGVRSRAGRRARTGSTTSGSARRRKK